MSVSLSYVVCINGRTLSDLCGNRKVLVTGIFNGGEVEIVKKSNMQAMITVSTRWFPRWLQKLVSTHELRETPWPNFRGGGGYSEEVNSKCQVLGKFQFLGWRVCILGRIG